MDDSTGTNWLLSLPIELKETVLLISRLEGYKAETAEAALIQHIKFHAEGLANRKKMLDKAHRIRDQIAPVKRVRLF